MFADLKYTFCRYVFYKELAQPGEIAQELRALIAGPGFGSQHPHGQIFYNSSSVEFNLLFWLSWALHVCVAQTYVQKKHIK